MIINFICSETEKIWKGLVSRRLPIDIQVTARKKLRMLNNAHILDDLRSSPGNRLELLKEDMMGVHSIRINEQWRICFIWENGNICDVRIMDYH